VLVYSQVILLQLISINSSAVPPPHQQQQPHPLATKNFFEQNWLGLGKFSWIWAKLKRNLGKVIKFGKE